MWIADWQSDVTTFCESLPRVVRPIRQRVASCSWICPLHGRFRFVGRRFPGNEKSLRCLFVNSEIDTSVDHEAIVYQPNDSRDGFFGVSYLPARDLVESPKSHSFPAKANPFAKMSFRRFDNRCRDPETDDITCRVYSQREYFELAIPICNDTINGGERSEGSNRVNRGGSWNNSAANCRTANRNRNDPANRNNNLGFRVCLSSVPAMDFVGPEPTVIPS